MKPDSEDFTQLRRLLALKRYEQPPPGYFHNFPGEVMARIRAGDRGEPREDTWFGRFLSLIEAKPVFAGAFGASLCVLLISGIVNTDEPSAVAGSDLMPPQQVAPVSFHAAQPLLAVDQDPMVHAPLTTDTESMEALFERAVFELGFPAQPVPVSGSMNVLGR
jgi:hypothetical protein